MAVYRYPPEVHDFVQEHAPFMRDKELAAACNEALGTAFTANSMKAFRGNHGYKNYRKQWSREEYWRYQTKYPQGMYEFIRDNSRGVSSGKMAEMVNEKFGTNWTRAGMKQFRQRNGIRSGCTGQFEKGHIPDNKGKTLDEYINDPERVADIRQRISGTQFKAGQAPLNELPIGAIVTNAHGYKLRKKSMTGGQWDRWEFLQRAVWEEHNGPIPEGMLITFRDGDKSNCDIGNLLLVTKAENAQLNKLELRSGDPDLTETGLNLIRLKNAARKRRKKQ